LEAEKSDNLSIITMAFTSTMSLSDSEQTSSLLPRELEHREWWMWGLAVLVTLALTTGIVFLTFFGGREANTGSYWTDLRDWVRGLAALV
jgi:hypothetical protein